MLLKKVALFFSNALFYQKSPALFVLVVHGGDLLIQHTSCTIDNDIAPS